MDRWVGPPVGVGRTDGRSAAGRQVDLKRHYHFLCTFLARRICD